MDPMQVAKIFAQSLLLGALIGLQRERQKRPIAGIRTFPLVAALGTACALLARQYTGWILAAGFLTMGGFAITSGILRYHVKKGLSTTTQMAMLLTFALGALLVQGPPFIAIAVGVVMAALLQYKPELHGFAQGLQSKDVYAVVQFALITFVVLPVLPDKTVDPFHVISLRQVWWMVVLVSGMSLASYAGLKLLGGRYGTLVSGLVGGLVSSTATTLTLSRRTKQGESVEMASAAIMAASGVVFLRIAAIVGVIEVSILPRLIVPMAGLFVVGVVLAALLAFRQTPEDVALPEIKNPCEVRFSLIFALMYAVVLFLLAAGRHYLGNEGIYVVSAVSGLTDMDAIAISVARLVGVESLDMRTAVRAIIVASMANMVFKTCLVAALGNRRLLKRTGIGFGVLFATGIAAVALV
ncbi:MAG: MgtC/SapB family protein [Phycisphaerae bacterium]|nr:MgtC/SapB family protein [Phycisphaerae bacterium]